MTRKIASRAALGLAVLPLVAITMMWLRSGSVMDTIVHYGQTVEVSGLRHWVGPAADISGYSGRNDGARAVRSRVFITSFRGDIVITALYVSFDISTYPTSHVIDENMSGDLIRWFHSPVAWQPPGHSAIRDKVRAVRWVYVGPPWFMYRGNAREYIAVVPYWVVLGVWSAFLAALLIARRRRRALRGRGFPLSADLRKV
jgi:hypothetical protein